MYRYIRRPATVYKRPSTLCIPLACQPDPAIQYRRVRRTVPAEIPPNEAPIQESITRRHSLPTPIPINTVKPKKVVSRRSLDNTRSRLDSILERYENILGKNTDEDNLMVGDQEIPKSLKPKIPQVRNEKPQVPKITKQQIPEIMKNAETFEVEEITSEVLDELLSELSENGLSDIINFKEKDCNQQTAKRQSISEDYATEKSFVGNCIAELANAEKNIQLELPVKDVPKSYNYQDIKDSIQKINYNSESDDGKSQKLKNLEKSLPVTNKISKINARDALELHRTKSYVVNLIDAALSSHLGTNANEKNTKNSREYMDPKSAVEMLKRHSSGKMDKELCLEIAQVLTDSFVSSSTAPTFQKASSECSCKSQSADEPAFVKQLKQMRWGHLKHIQREVRRLEDLERFLDSCSISSFDKCTNN